MVTTRQRRGSTVFKPVIFSVPEMVIPFPPIVPVAIAPPTVMVPTIVVPLSNDAPNLASSPKRMKCVDRSPVAEFYDAASRLYSNRTDSYLKPPSFPREWVSLLDGVYVNGDNLLGRNLLVQGDAKTAMGEVCRLCEEIPTQFCSTVWQIVEEIEIKTVEELQAYLKTIQPIGPFARLNACLTKLDKVLEGECTAFYFYLRDIYLSIYDGGDDDDLKAKFKAYTEYLTKLLVVRSRFVREKTLMTDLVSSQVSQLSQ